MAVRGAGWSRRGQILVLLIAVTIALLGVAGFRMLTGPPGSAKDVIDSYVAGAGGFAHKVDRWRESPNGRCPRRTEV